MGKRPRTSARRRHLRADRRVALPIAVVVVAGEGRCCIIMMLPNEYGEVVPTVVCS